MKLRHFYINILGLMACVLMIAAMLFPWWSFTLEFSRQTDLYPYRIDGPGSELVGYKRSPQMTLLTGVLVGCIGLSLAGSFFKGRAGRLLLGASGLLVFLSAWRLLLRIESVAARFHIPIQGHGIATYEGFARIEVATWLRPGIYLIILAGTLALAAGLFQPKARKGS